MRIILDIDDVLADTFGAIEDRFGKAADATTDDLRLVFPDTDVMSVLDNEEFHLSIAPVDGAAEGVRWLLDAGHDVQYLSSRPPAMESPTKEWLRQWQFPDLRLRCIGRELKKSALRSDPYDLLIDDMMRYLTIAKERGKQTIAFANPWNSTWKDVRVAGWS